MVCKEVVASMAILANGEVYLQCLYCVLDLEEYCCYISQNRLYKWLPVVGLHVLDHMMTKGLFT